MAEDDKDGESWRSLLLPPVNSPAVSDALYDRVVAVRGCDWLGLDDAAGDKEDRRQSLLLSGDEDMSLPAGNGQNGYFNAMQTRTKCLGTFDYMSSF